VLLCLVAGCCWLLLLVVVVSLLAVVGCCAIVVCFSWRVLLFFFCWCVVDCFLLMCFVLDRCVLFLLLTF
jgi:hypothetical protein